MFIKMTVWANAMSFTALNEKSHLIVHLMKGDTLREGLLNI
jgi:hypothetical protein